MNITKRLIFLASAFLTLPLGTLNTNISLSYVVNQKSTTYAENNVNVDKRLTIKNVLTEKDNLNSDARWVNAIKETTNNKKTIKLFYTRDASLVFQQSLLIISNLINNQNSKDFKIGFFIDQNVVNIQKFNTDLLKMNSSSEMLFISNLKNFGNGYKDLPYFVTPSTDFLEATLKHYDSLLKSGYKFDIFIPDISLVDVWYDNAFIKMLPYINKIYMLSDGNYQTFKLAENFVKSMKQYENVTIENFNNAIIENLKKMLDSSVSVQEKKELNQKYNFLPI